MTVNRLSFSNWHMTLTLRLLDFYSDCSKYVECVSRYDLDLTNSELFNVRLIKFLLQMWQVKRSLKAIANESFTMLLLSSHKCIARRRYACRKWKLRGSVSGNMPQQLTRTYVTTLDCSIDFYDLC
jgi:hypothetical protein